MKKTMLIRATCLFLIYHSLHNVSTLFSYFSWYIIFSFIFYILVRFSTKSMSIYKTKQM